jgi:hypothetical protein
MKKVIGLLILATLIIAMVGCSNSVKESKAKEEVKFTYSTTDGETTIDGIDGDVKPESLEIPSEIDGKKITAISEYAFANCDTVTAVTIAHGIEKIGSHAFSGCSKLASLTLPASLKDIDVFAFGETAIADIEIPDGVKTVGAGAFFKCEDLQSIEIPDSVTEIGDGALSGCKTLKEVILPKDITGIGSTAFKNCEKLESLTIPATVTTIGSNAFQNCASIKQVKFGGSEKEWDKMMKDFVADTLNAPLLNAEVTFE